MNWLVRFWAWLVAWWHRLVGAPQLPPAPTPRALDPAPPATTPDGGEAAPPAPPPPPPPAAPRPAEPAAPAPEPRSEPASPASSGRVKIVPIPPSASPAPAAPAPAPAVLDLAPAPRALAPGEAATPGADGLPAAQPSDARSPVARPPVPAPVAAPPGEARPAPVASPAAAPVVSLPSTLGPAITPLVAPPAAPVPAPPPPDAAPWWKRLAGGLSKTSNALSTGVTDLFSKRKLDDATLDDLEDLLIGADLGAPAAGRIRDALGEGRFGKDVSPDELKAVLAAEVERVLAPVARPLPLDAAKKPFVVLFVGVNGAGKTTTVGKLAERFRREGRSVVLAAADTFRAAAIDQLKVWGERAGATVVAKAQGSDAAGLAFEALERAKAENADVLLVDTAGRLQNRTELMDELAKIVRVMRKLDATAPHAVLLVLDATVGQNAISQAEAFQRTAGVTGLVMTKLDGTARGGILVALAERFKLPVHFIGVGEGAEDLAPFEAGEFARAVAGLEPLKEARA